MNLAVKPAIRRLDLADPADPRAAWSPSFSSFVSFDVVSRDRRMRYIGALFAILIVLDEPTPKDRLRRVSLIETADQYYSDGRQYNRFPGEGYREKASIDRAEPVDLSRVGLLRGKSNVSVGTERGKAHRTLVLFDAPQYQFVAGSIPSRSVAARIVIEDMAGRQVTVRYSFTLGVHLNAPDLVSFRITDPVEG
jgi:hypothetical protein